MKKEFSLPNAGYDTFTIRELMSGKYDYSQYKNWGEWTGLRDKNGKEIYEGDIIEWTRNKFSHHYQILWHEKHARWWMKGVAEISENQRSFEFDEAAKHLVIGNIYENPELLKS